MAMGGDLVGSQGMTGAAAEPREDSTWKFGNLFPKLTGQQRFELAKKASASGDSKNPRGSTGPTSSSSGSGEILAVYQSVST